MSISLENAGSAPLTMVTADLSIPEGKVESIAADPSGTHPEINNSGSNVTVLSKRMLPTDLVKFSAMISSMSSNPKADLAVRSNEVLGSEIGSEIGERNGSKERTA